MSTINTHRLHPQRHTITQTNSENLCTHTYTHTKIKKLSLAHTYRRLWMEQAVIRTVNGFSVVVNCSLYGSGWEVGEGREEGGVKMGVIIAVALMIFFLFSSFLSKL